MMDFIVMTLSIAGGILLAMFVMFVLMLQPAVMKLYTKLVMRQFEHMVEPTKDETKDL